MTDIVEAATGLLAVGIIANVAGKVLNPNCNNCRPKKSCRPKRTCNNSNNSLWNI
jgi:hypothetical protein